MLRPGMAHVADGWSPTVAGPGLAGEYASKPQPRWVLPGLAGEYASKPQQRRS